MILGKVVASNYVFLFPLILILGITVNSNINILENTIINVNIRYGIKIRFCHIL